MQKATEKVKFGRRARIASLPVRVTPERNLESLRRLAETEPNLPLWGSASKWRDGSQGSQPI